MTLQVYRHETVVEIIQEINKLHKTFSINSQDFLNCNLKKTINKIATKNGINQEFQSLINKYKSELLNKLTINLLQLQSQFPGIRYRVKQSESIREKILYYLGPEHEYGKVPINKSLNDFLGFRIFVENLELIYHDLKCDSKVTDIVARMYLRENGDYVGLHIYFKNKNNKFFSWELQIWSINKSELNEQSHKEHKQKRKYISIPQNYYEADLEKEG